MSIRIRTDKRIRLYHELQPQRRAKWYRIAKDVADLLLARKVARLVDCPPRA